MRKRGWVTAAAAFAVVGIAAAAGRLRRFAIVDGSMRPALEPNDWVVALRRGDKELRRGDIVVFADPDHPDRNLVKRVVGLPDERIEIGNGQVHVDGAVLAEPWANGPTWPVDLWEIPPDSVFVLGDDRSASSRDSRTIGPVPVSSIGWIVTTRYWPASRFGSV